MCKTTNLELEKRLRAAEKNSYKSEEKHFDNLLKELTLKYKRELSSCQKDVHNLNNKLTTKVGHRWRVFWVLNLILHELQKVMIRERQNMRFKE